jgi:hypothetical protein
MGGNYVKDSERLDKSAERMFTRLSPVEHLGIQAPLPLLARLDDTPIDSFLANLSEDLDAYEQKLFALMEEAALNPAWIGAATEVSMLWGREIAQECLMSRKFGGPEGDALNGVYELLLSVIEGGEFHWRPLLLRRTTRVSLQYELRRCPHRRFASEGASAATACRLEAMVFHGFAQAWLPDLLYERLFRGTHCLDELSIP